jgi:hypothetical protein
MEIIVWCGNCELDQGPVSDEAFEPARMELYHEYEGGKTYQCKLCKRLVRVDVE